MSLSSNSSLKRIGKQIRQAGFSVSEPRIRKACLNNNFDIEKASSALISEERLKVYLEKMCIKRGYPPSKKIILFSCIKYRFELGGAEKYTLRLLESRREVRNICIKSNITISDEKLDKNIIGTFGNVTCAFDRIKWDL